MATRWGAAALLALSLLTAARAGETQTRIRAKRLRIERGGRVIEASGDVRLEIAGCTLGAAGASLRDGTLTLRAARLRDDDAELSASSMRVGGVPLRVALRGARLLLCRRAGALALRVDAASARVSRSGARLHLGWPRMRVGVVPVFFAPYWSVPLRSGVSGIGAPSLGYSARDGVRAELPLYFALARRADALLAPGYVASRGPRLRARWRVFGQQAGGSATLRTLADGETVRGDLRGLLAAGASRASALVAFELLSDPRFARDLDREPRRVFAPYSRSRVAASAWLGPLAGALAFDLLQQLAPPGADLGDGAAAEPRNAPGAPTSPVTVAELPPARLRAAATLQLTPVPLGFGLLALGELDAVYRSDALLRSGVAGRRRVDELFLGVAPALAFARALGRWLRVDALVRYRFTAARQLGVAPMPTTRAGASTRSDGAHSGRFGLELSLPLARRFGTLRHEISPFVGVQGALGGRQLGEGGLRLDLARRRAALVGVRTHLARAGRQLARLHVATLVRDIDSAAGAARLAAALRVGARHHLALRALVDLGTARVADIEGRLCLLPGTATLCAALVRQRLQRFGELLVLDGAAWLGRSPLLTSGDPRVLALSRADQVRFSVAAPLGPLSLAATIAVDTERGEVAYARYAATLTFGCGCYRVGVVALSRAGQRHDGFLELAVRPGRLLGCLTRTQGR